MLFTRQSPIEVTNILSLLTEHRVMLLLDDGIAAVLSLRNVMMLGWVNKTYESTLH